MSIYSPEFLPTYLYIKQHTITGKLYFGKTIKSNIEKYLGSGTHWTNHIKKHGKEHVINIWYCIFYNQEDCMQFAMNFSKQQNIVESKDWLNQTIENGLGGAPKGCKGKIGSDNGMFGKTHSEEICNLQRERISIRNKTSNWYNNGTENTFSIYCPEGFVQGRINQKPSTTGNKWYNDGIINISSKTPPLGNQWKLGMLPKITSARCQQVSSSNHRT